MYTWARIHRQKSPPAWRKSGLTHIQAFPQRGYKGPRHHQRRWRPQRVSCLWPTVTIVFSAMFPQTIHGTYCCLCLVPSLVDAVNPSVWTRVCACAGVAVYNVHIFSATLRSRVLEDKIKDSFVFPDHQSQYPIHSSSQYWLYYLIKELKKRALAILCSISRT